MSRQLTRSHEEAAIDRFKKDPSFAAEYLEAVLKDGNEAELLQTLQRFFNAVAGGLHAHPTKLREYANTEPPLDRD